MELTRTLPKLLNSSKEFVVDMSVISAIGNTPMVCLQNTNGNRNVRIYANIEGNNPGGSIKDRQACYIITRAEQSGELTQ